MTRTRPGAADACGPARIRPSTGEALSRPIHHALPLPLPLPLSLALALALAGCGKAAKSAPACSVEQEKAEILAYAQDLYLWRDELVDVDPVTCVTRGASSAPQACDPTAYLNALTAGPRAGGRDRHFSFLTTQAAFDALFHQGVALGFGFSPTVRGSRYLVVQTYPGSAVAAAGIQRGDEIVAIATTSAGLDAASAQLSDILRRASADPSVDPTADPAALSRALGSGQVSTRAFRVRPNGATATRDVIMTSGPFGLDPVPGATSPTVHTVGSHRIGYLPLRTFISAADADLRTAAGKLKAAGVTDLVVDLRYNGGGLNTTANVLLDLLGGARAVSDVAYALTFNSSHAGDVETIPFAKEDNALTPARVAFIVTGASASASELVINALQPYLAKAGGPQDLAIVGGRTFGKPVGQFVIEGLDCGAVLFLVTFKHVNAEGAGDYYAGLPDAGFRGATCLAEDDLTHPMGDAAEASTAAALDWIAGGACAGGPIPAASAALAAQRRVEREALEVSEPTLAQRHIPGLN